MAKNNYLVDLDLNQNQLLNAVIQNLATAPATAGLKAGFVYFNTVTKTTMQWNGTAWLDLGNIYTHPTQAAINPTLTGAKVLTTLTVNTEGHVTAAATRDLTPANIGAEPAFTKNTGFNKNLGTAAGTVAEGNHTHTFAQITSKPTTVDGFGITDAIKDGTAAQTAKFNVNGGEFRDFMIVPKVDPASPAAGKHYIFSSDDYGAGGGGGTIVIASINEIGDVTITNPVTGQALVWNGTKWANQTVTSVNDAATNTTQTWSSSKISTAINDINGTITGGLINKGAYNAATNAPLLDATPIVGIKNGWTYVISAAGLFFTEEVQIGDMIIAKQDSPTTLAHWTVINKNIPDIVYASETVAGIAELASQAEVTAGTDHTKIVTAKTLQDNVASATNRGVTQLATQAEVTTGTDASKVVTPATLKGAMDARVGGFSATFGNASLTTFPITHNLNTLDVQVEIIEVATGETVIMQVRRNTVNQVTLYCNLAPALNQYKVIIKK